MRIRTTQFLLAIANGQNSANFAVQGVETATPLPSTVTITVSAPGFTNGSGTANVVQPAVRLSGPSTTQTSLDANDSFAVWVGVPSSGTVTAQSVRGGGPTLTATVTNSNGTAAQLVTSGGDRPIGDRADLARGVQFTWNAGGRGRAV